MNNSSMQANPCILVALRGGIKDAFAEIIRQIELLEMEFDALRLRPLDSEEERRFLLSFHKEIGVSLKSILRQSATMDVVNTMTSIDTVLCLYAFATSNRCIEKVKPRTIVVLTEFRVTFQALDRARKWLQREVEYITNPPPLWWRILAGLTNSRAPLRGR